MFLQKGNYRQERVHDTEKDNGLPFLSLEFILQTAVTLVPFENVLAESSYFFLNIV